MKLEEQVCSLDLAKRLKELGIEQESLYYWYKFSDPIGWEICGYRKEWIKQQDVSAFTVAELGEMLPGKIKEQGKTFFLDFKKDVVDGNWLVAYENDSAYVHTFSWIATEADTRAEMLEYLLENKLI